MRGFKTPPPARWSTIERPVLCSAERTWAALAPGWADRINAHAPARCGAAIDVPFRTVNPPPGTDELIDTPGAKKSSKPDTFEKAATTSPLVVAPTLIAEETQAGAPRAST